METCLLTMTTNSIARKTVKVIQGKVRNGLNNDRNFTFDRLGLVFLVEVVGQFIPFTLRLVRVFHSRRRLSGCGIGHRFSFGHLLITLFVIFFISFGFFALVVIFFLGFLLITLVVVIFLIFGFLLIAFVVIFLLIIANSIFVLVLTFGGGCSRIVVACLKMKTISRSICYYCFSHHAN